MTNHVIIIDFDTLQCTYARDDGNAEIRVAIQKNKLLNPLGKRSGDNH